MFFRKLTAFLLVLAMFAAPVAASAEDGVVEITAYVSGSSEPGIPGDYNGDKLVNLFDLMELRAQIIAGNGGYDVGDLVQLRNRILTGSWD